jgi:predicted SprT family Zn-dependent metalloprotease
VIKKQRVLGYNPFMNTIALINKKADSVWLEFCEIYPRLIRLDRPVIVANNRFTRTAANCEVENNVINFGMKFMAKHENQMLNVILPHEIAHQIDYILHGLPKRWHGRTWQEIMVKYGLPADAYHTMEI